MPDDVKRVVMDANDQTLIHTHGLRDWVEKTDDWPSGRWNAVVDRVREAYIEAELDVYADDPGSVIAGVAALVVKRQTFIDYFLDKRKRNYKPKDNDEWRSIAQVVARILVQRYYREMQQT